MKGLDGRKWSRDRRRLVGFRETKPPSRVQWNAACLSHSGPVRSPTATVPSSEIAVAAELKIPFVSLPRNRAG